MEPAPLVRRALARYLGRHFDEVVAVATPDAALAGAPEPTHIVCSSRSLDTIRRWRDRRPGGPRVILLSGAGGLDALDGADAVVREPCDPRELLECLLRTTDVRRAQAAISRGDAAP